MSDISDLDPKELLKRLQALEIENAKLKDASITSPLKLVVIETEYKGHSMLEFRRANAKPFSIGLKKLETIKEGWENVEKFLHKNSREKPDKLISEQI